VSSTPLVSSSYRRAARWQALPGWLVLSVLAAALLVAITVISSQLSQADWSELLLLAGTSLALAWERSGLVGLGVAAVPMVSLGAAIGWPVTLPQVGSERRGAMPGQTASAVFDTLGAVVDAYDVYTYGHSAQVAVYAEALAKVLGVKRRDREILVKAALVHDLGKVGITDRIIAKPKGLTDEEFNIVKSHPLIGAEILGRMKGLDELIPLVRYHHERWDGGGYPYGLQGEDIPMGARILALADTLDAMCSDRPYRNPLSLQAVQAEVDACAGTQFDPRVVSAFHKVLAERGSSFFRNSAATVDHSLPLAEAAEDPPVRHLKRSAVLSGQA